MLLKDRVINLNYWSFSTTNNTSDCSCKYNRYDWMYEF